MLRILVPDEDSLIIRDANRVPDMAALFLWAVFLEELIRALITGQWPVSHLVILGGFALLLFTLVAFPDRSAFVFDAEEEVLSWKRGNLFRRSSGEVPFSEIQKIEPRPVSKDPDEAFFRLVLTTGQGDIPFSNKTYLKGPVIKAANAAMHRMGKKLRFPAHQPPPR